MDQRLRELERNEAASGRLLRERLRAGALAPERLRLAAALGHPGAREALGEPVQDSSLAALLALAAALGPEGPLCVAAAATREALSRHELWLMDALPRVRAALEAVEAWTGCPCEEHRRRAEERQRELGPLPRPGRWVVRPRAQVELAARRALLAAAEAQAAPRAAAALAAAEAAELALAGATALGERRAWTPERRPLPLLEARPRLQAWALGAALPAPSPGVLDLVEAELGASSGIQGGPGGEAAALLRLLRAVRRGERDPQALRQLLLLGLAAPPALATAVGAGGQDWLRSLPRGPRGRAALAVALPLPWGDAGRAALIQAIRTLLEGRAVSRGLIQAHDLAIDRGGADAAAGYAARLCWDAGAAAAAGFRAAAAGAGVDEETARARARAAFVSWHLEGRDPLPRALAELEG